MSRKLAKRSPEKSREYVPTENKLDQVQPGDAVHREYNAQIKQFIKQQKKVSALDEADKLTIAGAFESLTPFLLSLDSALLEQVIRVGFGTEITFADVPLDQASRDSAAVGAFARVRDKREPPSAWEIARRAKLPRRAVPYAEGGQPGENVLQYYERVWGEPYRDKGILYRDDISELGDRNLLTVVAEHCRDNGLDPKPILPKKISERTKDELNEIDPNSARAELLRRRLKQRDSTAKARGAARGEKPSP